MTSVEPMTVTAQQCLIVRSQLPRDPRAAGLLADAHALGLARVTQLEIQELFFIEGDLCPADRQRLAAELLSDPIAQASEWRSAANDGVIRFLGADHQSCVIETALRPGVTDPVAEQIVRCAHMLGIDAVQRAATGKRFIVYGKLREADLHLLAKRLLANDVIERYAIGPIEPSFPHPAEASGEVDIIPVRELNDEQLLAVSRDRRAALDLAEMQAVQRYFRSIDRDPTDVEVEMIAQTWSEHCGHKTFKAKIDVSDQSSVISHQSSVVSNQRSVNSGQPPATSNQQPATHIDGILKTYLRAATEQINAPWVRSAFVDNAGIIDFDDEYEVSFKVETHNHPSAIEPFGGANTGVGGVIRDVLGVSAKPIAATDVLCFGPQDFDPKKLPEGVLHPRRIQSGVVAGVQDYGNKIGIPTVNGAILYDEGYTANPLVFCGCVGLAPKNSHPREPHPGDRVIVLGGRTGRDGLRGATFSSMTMDAQTGEVSGASVQIGDPITEKGLIEVTVRARDLKLYTAITDCGAGGLSSAVGEMSSTCGSEVDLKRVTLKYPGLAPWEIWLSEAQERMVLAVPEGHVPPLQALCDTFDVQLTDIGVFTDTGHIVVRYGDHVVLDLANEFLHHGIPRRSLTAVSRQPSAFSGQRSAISTYSPLVSHYKHFDSALLALLASPNIASKASVIRIYDHEVQGGTVVKPLTGVMNDGPSDGCVLKPIGTRGTQGIVLSNGINPELGKRDAYAMAINVIDEAIRNAVAVGADPERLALLDNFCWGDPLKPETLGSLIEAARGCYDTALAYGTPFISGKDSLNNEYLGSDGLRHAIPPTLLISAIGLIDDVCQAVTMDAKEAGNVVYVVEARGSLQDAKAMYCNLHKAMTASLVRACHDVSEGGLAVAAAEMCIGGRLGMSLTIAADDPALALFGEGNGRLLVEVKPDHGPAFEAQFDRAVVKRIGMVIDGPRLNISSRTQALISLPVETLAATWNRTT